MKEYLQEKEYYTFIDDTISKKKETKWRQVISFS